MLIINQLGQCLRALELCKLWQTIAASRPKVWAVVCPTLSTSLRALGRRLLRAGSAVINNDLCFNTYTHWLFQFYTLLAFKMKLVLAAFERILVPVSVRVAKLGQPEESWIPFGKYLLWRYLRLLFNARNGSILRQSQHPLIVDRLAHSHCLCGYLNRQRAPRRSNSSQ